jgi:hypothetical protein
MQRVRRLFINIALLILIAYVGNHYIVPTVICWQDGGTWHNETRACDMGTFGEGESPMRSATTVSRTQPPPQEGTPKDAVMYKDFLKVSRPAPYTKVTSPLIVQGMARGPWFFEGSFPVSVRDQKGAVIGVGMAEAEGEWMTEKFVPFTATIAFNIPNGMTVGTIMLTKDNPSGQIENDDAFTIPISF